MSIRKQIWSAKKQLRNSSVLSRFLNVKNVSAELVIIIIINEKINVAFRRRTARTRNSHKNKNRENVVSNSTEEKNSLDTKRIPDCIERLHKTLSLQMI